MDENKFNGITTSFRCQGCIFTATMDGDLRWDNRIFRLTSHNNEGCNCVKFDNSNCWGNYTMKLTDEELAQILLEQ